MGFQTQHVKSHFVWQHPMLLSILSKCDTYLPLLIILSLLLPLRRQVSRDQWWHYEQKWGKASESSGTTVGSLLATKKCHTTQLSFYLDWIQFTKIFFFFSVLLAYNTQVLTHLKKKVKNVLLTRMRKRAARRSAKLYLIKDAQSWPDPNSSERLSCDTMKREW